MQKIEGDGLAFVHSGGTMAKKELKEVLKVDRLHHWFYKMWIMISSSSAESKLDFGGEGYFTLHCARNRLCTIITFQ
jgi:uncharacterized protein (AIM24 family)